MNWMQGTLIIVLLSSGLLEAQDHQSPSQGELAAKPPYERMLSDEDEKRVAELRRHAELAEVEGQIDEAIKRREEIIALRTHLQGSDHWMVNDERFALTILSLDATGRRECSEASAINDEAGQLFENFRYAEAQPLLEKSLEIYRRVLGEDHRETATNYNNVACNLGFLGKYAEAHPLYQKSLDICRRVLGENHPDTATSCINVALNLKVLGKSAEAESLLQKSLEIRRRVLGEHHPDTADSYSNVASNLKALGKSDEAQLLYRKALDIRRRVLGEDHPDTAMSYNNTALNLRALGKSAEAEPLLHKSLEICRRVLGEDHPDTARSYSNLAVNLDAQGKPAEAESLVQKSLEIRRRVLGENHEETAQSYSLVASNLDARGRFAEAQPLFQKSLDVLRRVLGEDHRDTATGYISVALNLAAQGKSAEAHPLYQKSLDIYRRVLGEDHPHTATSYHNVASSLDAMGKSAEAEPLLQKSLDIRRRVLGEDHPDTADSYSNVASNLKAQGKSAEAQRLYRKALDIRRHVLGEDHPDTAHSYNNVACNLESLGKSAEAQPLFQKALDILRRVLGEDHPDTAVSYSNLASNQIILGNRSEATGLLERAVFSFEASRVKRAKGIERALGDAWNPRRLLAVLEQGSDPVEAWRQTELSLARGFLDQQASRRGLLTATEAERESEWRAQLNAFEPRILCLVSQGDRTPDEETELADLIRQRNEVGGKLSELAVELSERQVERGEAIQAALAPHAALVLWVDVGANGGLEEHFACVVRRDGGPFWAKLPGSGEQGQWTKADTELVGDLRRALAQDGPTADLGRLIDRARRQRFGPILEHLTQHGITQLCVVGVEAMAGVPVEVLVPEFTIGYVPSGTYLARLPGKPTYENTLLAVGDPVYTRAKPSAVQVTAMPPHGVLVREAVPTGSAAQAGISPGDVLLQYRERVLESVEQLKDAIEKATVAGDTSVAVRVWRVDAENNVFEKTLSLPVGPLGVVLALEPAPAAIADARQTEVLLAGLRGGETWDDLPGTRYEVSRISEFFPTARVLLDGEANERAVEGLRVSGELGRYRYLHFATHGKGNDATAFESKLALSQDAATEEFSTPGEPWMNNEISAREVLDYWKLDADLVTLSACESGLGKQGAGDGLLGFAQAFLVNGARSVCLSLWKVDDTATALLMRRFYENLLGLRPDLPQPMRKVDALREAKEWLRNLTAREALEATATLTGGVSRGTRGEITLTQRIKPDRPDDRPWAQPHFWAAFILIGDPE